MIYAPKTPTSKFLNQKFPVSKRIDAKIKQKRRQINKILRGENDGLIVIIGPCSLTDKPDAIHKESQILKKFADDQSIQLIRRLNVWKPRTNPLDWHGLETTKPEKAYAILHKQACTYADVALEFAHLPHLERYGKLTAFAWFGARHDDNAQKANIANKSNSLPIGVKNDLSGSLGPALNSVKLIKRSRNRGKGQEILIFRGGKDYLNPTSWENHYKQAYSMTEGKIIVDLAHGSEQAHDLNGKFSKSIKGQAACFDHIIDLTRQGYKPVGIMTEASNVISPTDPNMPLELALNKIKKLKLVIDAMGHNKV